MPPRTLGAPTTRVAPFAGSWSRLAAPSSPQWPEASQAKAKLALAPEALALLVGGVELKRGSLKPWYERDEK